MAKEISKSLIIGVGGTGQNILIAFKKRMYERFGVVPDLIKCISVDADIINEKDENFSFDFQGIINEEMIDIPESEQFYFGRVNMKSQLEEGVYKKFVPKEIKNIASHLSSGRGAEGKRIVGKMLLSSNYQKLERFINGKIEEIISKISTEYNISDTSTVRVFVVGSFAGGAGSSMFIDISSILKSSKHKYTIDLVGFFAMPEFYTQYPNQDNAMANAYGCFLELDHIQEPNMSPSKIIPDFNNFIIDETRFSSVYIIQDILSNNTKIKRGTMEDAIAAAISNLVSIIGDKGDEIGVNNLQFDDYKMNNKRRGYSSFGLCEIVLKRERLKKFLTNKLVLNALNNYKINNFTVDEFDKRRDEFINTHNLDEGIGNEAKKINKLIDSIYSLDNSELNIVFNEVSVSDSVIEDLKESYRTFKQELDAKSASLLISYDDDIFGEYKGKNGVKKNGIGIELQQLLEQLLYSNGGLSRTKLFAESLVSQIKNMRQELNREISEHQEAIDEIENTQLENIYSEIKEKQKGFWLKRGQIKNLIENYSYLISSPDDTESFRTHYLEIIRKQKAIDVYKKIISIVKIFYAKEGNESYGKVAVFENNINEAINDLGLENRQFIEANNEPFDKINIEINYFLIKVLENKEIYNEIVSNNPIDVAQYLSENSNTNNLIDDLKNKLMDNIDKSETILSKLNNRDFTVDKLINTYKNVKIKIGSVNSGYREIIFEEYLIREINNNLPIMWKYKDMNIKHDGKRVKLPELVAIIGNYDGEEGFISYNIISKFKGLPSKIGQNAYSRVATNNPNTISIYIQEHAIPAYKLYNMDAYKKDYTDLGTGSTSYYHTDIRFEKNVFDIFPQKNNEKTLHLWVIGFITGLIFNKKAGYYIKSKSGATGTDVKCFDESNSKGKGNRVLAFEYFSESENFPSEISEKYEEMLRDKEKIRYQLLDYLHNKLYERFNLGKFKTNLSEDESKLLFKEEKMIIKIGLDELKMHSRDFINSKLEGEDLTEHEQRLYDLGAKEVRL